MDDAEKIIGIVRGLLTRSLAGSVSWKDGGEDQFFTSIGNASVVVGLEDGPFGASPLMPRHLTVKILNRGGSLVSSARGDRNLGALAQDEWNALVSDLYAVARRQALRVDAVLDEILREVQLDDEEPP